MKQGRSFISPTHAPQEPKPGSVCPPQPQHWPHILPIKVQDTVSDRKSSWGRVRRVPEVRWKPGCPEPMYLLIYKWFVRFDHWKPQFVPKALPAVRQNSLSEKQKHSSA
jgi:hypothetical protein